MKISDFNIHDIINEAMKKKDRSVSIFFGKEGTSVTIVPLEEDSGEDKKTGMWKKRIDPFYTDGLHSKTPKYLYVCSYCGRYSDNGTAYCSHCGAEMRGVKES